MAPLHPESPAWYAALRRAALAWYRRHARDLPWRRRSDPYAIWVSEVMLQQTQVRTVEAYFERFMDRFPTVAALAAASQAEVLRVWEGLGYYRRARALWQAAQEIVARHGGAVPRTREELQQLPGIGPYSAGAILSIAYDQPEPVLEANTHRLWSRLLDWRHAPHSRRTLERLWDAARRVLPRRGAGRLNQALMELGARLCTPQRPRCEECPLARLCLARRRGSVHRVPRPRPRPRTEGLRQAAAVVRRNDSVLLVQADQGRWAGLWDFPRITLHDGPDPPQQLQQELHRRGIATAVGPRLLRLTHAVTRYRITLECFVLYYQHGALRGSTGLRNCWVPLHELDDYPLSATARRIAQQLASGSAAHPVQRVLPQKG